MRRLLLAVLLVGAAVVVAPGTAAAGTVQFTLVTMDVTPDRLPADIRDQVRLRFQSDTIYSDNTPPFTGKLTRLAYDLDPGFLVSPQGFPQCDPSTIEATTTEQALVICGAADIGSGSARLAGPVPDVSGDIEVFNGTPAAGVPRFVLHMRTSNDTTTVMTGTITPSPPGEGFGGQRLDLTVPILPLGFVFTSLDYAIRSGDYITGRCLGRRFFSYNVYYDTGGGGAGEINEPCEVRPVVVPQSPSNTVVVGPQNGTTQNNSELTLTVPGPGTVQLVGAPVPVAGKSQPGSPVAAAAKKPKKKKKKAAPQVLIAPAQVTAAAAGTVALPLTLTQAGLQALVRKGKLVSGVVITFTPTGGTASTTNATVTISGPKPKKKPKKK